MADVTLAELIRDCRSRLDETTIGFWSDEEISRWCWEAARDVARRTEWLQKTSTQNIVANQQTYSVPDDLFRVFRVEYVQTSSYSYALEIRNFANMDDLWLTGRTVAGSQPYACAFWGSPGQRGAGNAATQQLYLYPTPSTSVTNGLVLYYYGIPAKVGTNDFNAKVEVPSGWDDLVPLYVEVVARRKEARDSRWREAFELYELRLQELIKHTRSITDQQDTMVSGMSGFGALPAWLVGGDGW